MKTYLLRVSTVILVLATLFCCFSVTAAAETQTADLFTLEESRNMGISVAYTNGAPDVEFIAPGGEVYGTAAINSGKMTRTDSGKALFFRIPNAAAGSWQIRYDKKANADLEINYAPYATALGIKNLTFKKVDDTSLEVNFSTTHTSDLRFEYKIYAALVEDNRVIGQKEIGSGSAQANTSVKATAYLHHLSTYDNYRVLVEVTAQDNGLEVFNDCVADGKFAHTDANAAEAADDFRVQADMTEGSLHIDWSDTRARGNETLVAVYYNDSTAPAYFNNFTNAVSQTELIFDMAETKKIRIDLSYKDYYGKSSVIASRVIDVATAGAVSLHCEDITSSAQAEIKYDLSKLSGAPFKAVLTVNGKEQELSLSGSGSFAVQLEKFDNELSLVWDYDAFTSFKVGKSIYSDRVAPSLKLPDVNSTILTDQATYVLAGTVDPGCTVTVNGAAVTVDANGIFTTKLHLTAGKNVFTVIAAGLSGTRTQHTVVVERILPVSIGGGGTLSMILQFIPMIACALFSVSLGLFVLKEKQLFPKRKTAKDGRVATLLLSRDCSVFMIVVSAIATATFTALLVWSIIQTNSIAFFNTAVAEGIAAAYDLLQQRNTFIICTVVSVLCLAAMIALCVLFGRESKKAPKPKKPKTPKAPKAPKTPKVPKFDRTDKSAKPAFCGKCGKEVKPGAEFCGFCSNTLIQK